MKHIAFGELGWDYTPYFDYLETVRSKMPEALYRFAANVEHYDLESHTSLHDAWLEQLSIREIAEPGNAKARSVEISTTYLGPFHDLRQHIIYRDVTGYELRTAAGQGGFGFHKRWHGDVLVHEVRLAEDGQFEHELLFSSDSVFLIRFRKFEHRIEPIATTR